MSPALQRILLKWLRNFNHWSTREAPCPGFCALNFLPRSLQACSSKPNSSSICALVSPSENWEKTMAVIVIYVTGWSLGYSRQSRQRAENRAGPEKALLSLQSCPTLNSFHSKSKELLLCVRQCFRCSRSRYICLLVALQASGKLQAKQKSKISCMETRAVDRSPVGMGEQENDVKVAICALKAPCQLKKTPNLKF